MHRKTKLFLLFIFILFSYNLYPIFMHINYYENKLQLFFNNIYYFLSDNELYKIKKIIICFYKLSIKNQIKFYKFIHKINNQCINKRDMNDTINYFINTINNSPNKKIFLLYSFEYNLSIFISLILTVLIVSYKIDRILNKYT